MKLSKINRFTGEFESTEEEKEFLKDNYNFYRKRIQVTIFAGGIGYLLWGGTNFFSNSISLESTIILLSKLVVVGFLLICLYYTRKSLETYTKKLARWILVAELFTGVSEITEKELLPYVSDIMTNTGVPFIVFLILIFYIVVPNKAVYSFSALMVISIAYIVSTIVSPLESTTPITLKIAYFFWANFLGLGILITINKITRKDYSRKKVLEYEILQRKKAEKIALEAKKVAEKSNMAKSQFLAVVNHEMRTPLNVIIGGIELLSEYSLSQKENETISLIKSSSDHLGGLIQNILDFTSIENRSFKLIEREFSLEEFIIDIENTYKHLIRNKNINFYYNYTDISHIVIGDPVRLKQVLSNLLDNAYKYTFKGSITLNIICKKTSNKKINILFEVIDTGIGIPKDKVKEIFKPFSQVEEEVTREYQGCGLGLSICSGILDRMNSRINVESIENNGSKFSFNIALNRGINKTFKEFKKLETYNILLVDDNAANLRITSGLLELLNQNVTILENTNKIVTYLKEYKNNIILMDYHMPGINGIELFKKIENYTKEIKTFLITADTREEILEECKKSMITGFIPKPVSLTKLREVIENINSSKKYHDELIPVVKDEHYDKEFFDQIISDIGSLEFSKMFEECVRTLNDIVLKLKEPECDDFKNLIHQLTGLSGNYRLGKIYNYLITVKPALDKKQSIISMIDSTLKVIENIC